MTFSPTIDRIIRARHYTAANRKSGDMRLVVLHVMVSPEKPDTAEDVAHWFAGSTAPQASPHYCADNNSIVGCVDEQDVAWAAPGANHDGIQIELAGTIQTPQQWADAYSRAELVNAACLVADICRRRGIPARHLTNAQLAAGARGLIGHIQASQVYHQSDHTDPGAAFPWVGFMKDVVALMHPDTRYQYRLMDKNGKVWARSSITSRNGLRRRFTLFTTRVAPVVARLTVKGLRPRVVVTRVK